MIARNKQPVCIETGLSPGSATQISRNFGRVHVSYRAVLRARAFRPYSATGRPSIRPEKLLRAVLVQALLSVGTLSRQAARCLQDGNLAQYRADLERMGGPSAGRRNAGPAGRAVPIPCLASRSCRPVPLGHPPRDALYRQRLRAGPATFGDVPQGHPRLPAEWGASVYAAATTVIATGRLLGLTALAATWAALQVRRSTGRMTAAGVSSYGRAACYHARRTARPRPMLSK